MPDLHALERVRRVACFDGRSRITRVRYRTTDWERVRGRVRLTYANVERLRHEHVTEVEVRRWFRRARISMRLLHQHFH